MSFAHSFLIGHFDPQKLFWDRPLVPEKPIDWSTIDHLLNDFPPEVREYIEHCDGYVIAHWAPCPIRISDEVCEFSSRLRVHEGCLLAASPHWIVMEPQSAREAQDRAYLARAMTDGNQDASRKVDLA